MSYDSDVASATSGRGEPDWDKIIKLCNRIRESVGTLSMAQAMGSVMRRVKHTDPKVQLHALTLLESCVGNCGQGFQLEITKSTFHADVKTIVTGPYTDPRVAQRLKELLSSWANEFKNDTKMNPLIKFIEQLRRDGITFQGAQQPSSAVTATRPTPNPVAGASSQEDSDIKKAIQLSLLETKSSPAVSTPSLYPSVGGTNAPAQKQPQKKVARKRVRAIYDFVAAEDNELSFRAGEILTVVDDSDENWWTGETQLGRGLFPASFVSSNLSVEPQPSSVERKEKQTGGSNSEKTKGKKVKGGEPKKAVMNEEKIDLLLDMIKGADVTSDENKAENDTLVELEEECKKMKPVVDETISALQCQDDEMQAINKKFEEALALYRKHLAEGPRLSSSALPQKHPSSVSPQAQPSLSEPTQHPTPPSQPHTVLPSQAQPPPYTANTVAASTAMYAPQVTQSVYTPELSIQPSSLQQPSSLAYGGLMTGTTHPVPEQVNTFKQPQSLYTQQPDSLQPQTTLRTGFSPTTGAQLMSVVPPTLPSHYQPSFYPQQQPAQVVQQPLL